jgi:hypothetical protein
MIDLIQAIESPMGTQIMDTLSVASELLSVEVFPELASALIALSLFSPIESVDIPDPPIPFGTFVPSYDETVYFSDGSGARYWCVPYGPGGTVEETYWDLHNGKRVTIKTTTNALYSRGVLTWSKGSCPQVRIVGESNMGDGGRQVPVHKSDFTYYTNRVALNGQELVPGYYWVDTPPEIGTSANYRPTTRVFCRAPILPVSYNQGIITPPFLDHIVIDYEDESLPLCTTYPYEPPKVPKEPVLVGALTYIEYCSRVFFPWSSDFLRVLEHEDQHTAIRVLKGFNIQSIAIPVRKLNPDPLARSLFGDMSTPSWYKPIFET